MFVQANPPTHNENTLGAMKAKRAVKRVTFDRSEANPGEALMPGSLALLFDIGLTGGHSNNFLVQNVSRTLVENLVVKYAGTVLQETVGFDIFKIWEDLFLLQEELDNMLLEGVQTEKLCKI